MRILWRAWRGDDAPTIAAALQIDVRIVAKTLEQMRAQLAASGTPTRHGTEGQRVLRVVERRVVGTLEPKLPLPLPWSPGETLEDAQERTEEALDEMAPSSARSGPTVPAAPPRPPAVV